MIKTVCQSFIIKTYLYLAIGLLSCSNIHSQSSPIHPIRIDSLKNKSYDELYYLFHHAKDNDTLHDLYAYEYINKAYKERDTLKIATGYYIITLHEKDRCFKCYDSLIKYSKFIKADSWLWSAYFDKGDYFNRKRQFKKALNSHIKAYEYAKIFDDDEYLDLSITSLGIIKEKIGRYKDALEDFKKSLEYTSSLVGGKVIDSIDERSGISHLSTLHLLSNSYRLNKKLDSADFLNMDVQKYRTHNWAKKYLNKFTLNSAEVHYDRKQYQQAIDSASASISLFAENNNLKSIAVAYYIKGMSEYGLGELKTGINSLEKMDSIYDILGNIYLSVRPGYHYLRNYYKSEHNITKQLYYVEQLLKFDSIAHTNYTYISEEIVNKIDKPKLLREKKELSQQLESSKTSNTIFTVVICIILLVLITEILRRKRLKKIYQRKFDELLDKVNKKNTSISEDFEDEPINKNEIGIEQSVVDIIMEKLKDFEDKKQFTKQDITATEVAKNLGTNANYLGRIINYYYDKNFRNYINDLRINLALKKIRDDKNFIKYSIISMAKEVGFKNSEPFAKAFKSKTNMNPSDFIAKLKKK